ncbi:MAG: DUF424 family protein [Candidatus Micrarchaeota archaeon]|nr:DUF424 family protein [Candidatus Micrarchaeota archaeon]MDE1849827.1 DUF424 family protein [Candidatus Micrarchaeota archaeon]
MKRYDTEKGMMIAMCDEELIGREFSEGRAKLDLNKYASFYKGELLDQEKIKIDIENIYSANVVGERSVAIILKSGMANPEDIKRIKGVEFLQVYKLNSSM